MVTNTCGPSSRTMYEFIDHCVSDAMTRDPITVYPGTRVGEVEGLFEAHPVNAFPVTDQTRTLVGVVTKLDLLKAFSFTRGELGPQYGAAMERPVSEVISDEVHSVGLRTPLTRVLEELVRLRIKSLPVAVRGEVVGIISREDVLRALRGALSQQTRH